MYDVSISV